MKITPTLFESELHREMQLDDKSLREELQSSGLDPESEASALRVMISIALRRAMTCGHASCAGTNEALALHLLKPVTILRPRVTTANNGIQER